MGSDICHLIGLDAHKPKWYVKNSGIFVQKKLKVLKTAVTSLLLTISKFFSPRVLKIEHFFFLQLIANEKKELPYITMIDLGKSKEVKAI